MLNIALTITTPLSFGHRSECADTERQGIARWRWLAKGCGRTMRVTTRWAKARKAFAQKCLHTWSPRTVATACEKALPLRLGHFWGGRKMKVLGEMCSFRWHATGKHCAYSSFAIKRYRTDGLSSESMEFFFYVRYFTIEVHYYNRICEVPVLRWA